jgi:type VI secretion system secreted protein Hcp
MANVVNSLIGTAVGAGADMFLYVKPKGYDVFKGESQSPGHMDEIQLSGWNWGISSSSAIGHTEATSRRSYTGLTVRKHLDSASTSLMTALVKNYELTEVRLSMRRAGGEQEDYYTIKLEKARVSAVQQDTNASGDAVEVVTFMFTKVEAEYRPQKSTGLRGGSRTFADDIAPLN